VGTDLRVDGSFNSSIPCRSFLNLTVKSYKNQGAPWSWKVTEFRKTIFQAWKVRKIAKVMESHGK